MSMAIPLARLRTSLARRASFLGAVALVLLSCAGVARAERLKDIAALAGVRIYDAAEARVAGLRVLM